MTLLGNLLNNIYEQKIYCFEIIKEISKQGISYIFFSRKALGEKYILL